MEKTSADVGLIGLAVMGQNLVLNMNDHGFTVAVFNRTVAKVTSFLSNEAKGTKVIGTTSLAELCAVLSRPRKIILMVKAGDAVDAFIAQLVPLLERGDILIDAGNSYYVDTIRRVKELNQYGLLYVGSGVSGGEEGARHGPSMMPGGPEEAWPHIQAIFQAIAAKTDGKPCCDWVGSSGSGHYVKMVHNGIEYGDMQLISEAYHVMKAGLQMGHVEMAATFDKWNAGELNSYLIEITRDILKTNDVDGKPLVEKICDMAGQKGTGKWTTMSSLDLGIPVTLIGEAVYARCLSSFKDERVRASKLLAGPRPGSDLSSDARNTILSNLGMALYAAKIISYTQGFMLLREAAKEFKWNLNYGQIALMWRGGCIIRSRFLGDIKNAFDKSPQLESLLFDAFFSLALEKTNNALRTVVSEVCKLGIPVPALSAALAFYDGYRTEYLPANLLQAQRDYFGAHTYERLIKPGLREHFDWTGKGGKVTSTSYDV